jgi:hypothetical protein
MMAKEKFEKTKNGERTIWEKVIILLVPNLCFLIGVVWLIFKKFIPDSGVDPNAVSLIFALFGLNLAVTFFIPMLITKHQVTDAVKEIVDKTLVEKNMVQYATQMNIADLLQKVSSLLFWQKRYIWSLSCALNALNEYMGISPDEMRNSKIINLWISIESMTNIVVNKYSDSSLLKNEFPISNEEIKLMGKKNWREARQMRIDQLAEDKKYMLIWFYTEIFKLAYQKENLIQIIGYEYKDQINCCLNNNFIKIINDTANECSIKYEEIESGIRKNAEPFGCSETRRTAEEVLRSLIKIENVKSV